MRPDELHAFYEDFVTTLREAGAPGKELQAAAQELLQTQRDDGGWGQLDKLDSDAYATGSALVVLRQAGGLALTMCLSPRRTLISWLA